MKETTHTMSGKQVNRLFPENAQPGEAGYGGGFCLFQLFMLPALVPVALVRGARRKYAPDKG